jgi:carbonic anhydrase
MRVLKHLFDNNRAWSRRMTEADPEFFTRLMEQQAPQHLWIGCSDSRVPANEIVDLAPGELFVHRNVANVVVHTDLNCLSVLQFAVDRLQVRDVVVVGHYGCGGVRAVLEGTKVGLADNWLRHVQDVRDKHAQQLVEIDDASLRLDRLCELNVIEQVNNVCQTTVVQDAWARGQELAIHGWIYRLQDGLLHDLRMCVTGADDLAGDYASALEKLVLEGAV